jgi:uncharacterized surface protein with fasciclin (FAS1) repeats
MTKNKQLTFITLLVLLFFGCKDDKLTGIYAPPSWLPGKLFSQIQSKPELTTFAELVKISGYDTIINVSGSFTVFAPSNDAFTQYFQSNPKYKKVADIPKAEVVKLVKYHIVQDGWTKKQLMSLDVNGWIDSLDLKNNLPKGYKRQTLLMEKNRKYGVRWSKYLASNQVGGSVTGNLKRTDIIDTTATTWYRRVITDSRKYAPIFYKQYFDIYNLSTSDFEFYFGRPFLSGNDLYYCGGRITSDELFAENGFVYVIDEVIDPLKNGLELLTDNSKNNYSTFYNLLNLFSEFSYNSSATSKQPGYAQGFKVDSLFNLSYPKLVFDINSELTKAPRGTYGLPSNVSIRYHQGILAPTNGAMDQLVSQYLAGGNNWGSIDNAPENIKRIIVNSCLSINPIYPTDVQKGIQNGESDNIVIDASSIVQKEYGSSCTFIGVNKPVVPRAFSSVTGPIYLRKGFSKVMYAIESSGLLPALKKQGVNYSVYVESDNSSSIDSTLLMKDGLFGQKVFSLSTMKGPDGKQGAAKAYPLQSSDLRTLILNQVATGQPKGIARKEFVRNLAGNYLIFDNVTHVVQGTSPSTFGYNGIKQVNNIPRQISTNSDNGYTYEIDSWFNFSINSVFSTLLVQFPKFHALIKRAGLSNDALSTYTFMSPTVNYTVFAPSDSLLNTMNTNAMSQAELKSFVMMHFIPGQILFTDGNISSRYYETCRIDEKSSQFATVYTKIKVLAGIDKITIASVDGSKDVIVNESPRTNIIMSKSLSTNTTDTYINSVANGVVHEINKPLLFGQVDTQ